MSIEGNGFSKLAQVIRHTGYNKDIDIELAEVTSPPPSLKIKINGMNVELEKDDLLVAERLTMRTCNTVININGTPSNASIEYLDELKAGDKVIVASIAEGQSYVILDRAVIY